MAPKLRPRRMVKKESRLQPERDTAIRPVNSTGIAALPAELLLEIVNHVPQFPVPCKYTESPIEEETHTRQGLLRTLVQSCRSFRRALLPYMWREVILCSLHSAHNTTTTDPAWISHLCALKKEGYCLSCEKQLAYEIVSQLEIVTFRVPEYATRVQILSIFIPRYSAKTIVPEFARCLALLPNLRTLQLHFSQNFPYGSWLYPIIGKVFPKYKYESIQTLVIPCSTVSMIVIQACPNLRHLHFTSSFTSFGVFQPLKCSPSVEKLTGKVPSWLFPRFQIVVPNLKYVQMRATGGPSVLATHVEYINSLAQLPRIEVVEIALTRPEAKLTAEAMQDAAKDVLARMPNIPGTHRRVVMCDYTNEYQPGGSVA